MNFAGAVLAWGVLVPMLIYFLGPELYKFIPAGSVDNEAWDGTAVAVFKFIVRPIAVGGMLVGAGATLFRMRKSLSAGLSRAFADLAAKAKPDASIARTERYMSSKTIFGLIAIVFIGMVALYISFAGT